MIRKTVFRKIMHETIVRKALQAADRSAEGFTITRGGTHDEDNPT
jgi:hypothetical protein